MTTSTLLYQYPYMQPDSSGQLVPKLLDVIEIIQNKLIISGHAHWNEPVATLGNDLIIKTDARIVILR